MSVLHFKFQYSPTSQFGEYELGYKVPPSKDNLRYIFNYIFSQSENYRFEYKALSNKSSLKHKFSYSSYQFDKYTLSYKLSPKENSLEYTFSYPLGRGLSEHKFIYSVADEICIENTTSTEYISEIFQADHDQVYLKKYSEIKNNINEKFLGRLLTHDLMFDHVMQCDFYKGVTHRSYDANVDNENRKLSFKAYLSHHIFDLINEDRVHKVNFKDDVAYHIFDLKSSNSSQKLDRSKTRYIYVDNNLSFNNKNYKFDILNCFVQILIDKVSSKNMSKGNDPILETIKNLFSDKDSFLRSIKELFIDYLHFLKSEKHIIKDNFFLLDVNKNLNLSKEATESLLNLNREEELFNEKSVTYINKDTTKEMYRQTNDSSTLNLGNTDLKVDDTEKTTKKHSSNNIGKIAHSSNLEKAASKQILSSLGDINFMNGFNKDILRDVYNYIEKADKNILNEDIKEIEKLNKSIIKETDIEIEKTYRDILKEEIYLLYKPDKNLYNGKENKHLSNIPRDIEKEEESQLSLHKRFWFLKHHGEIDYKILPNVDYEYPINLDSLVSPKFRGEYKYSYTGYFTQLNDEYQVIAYDSNFYKIGSHSLILNSGYINTIENIEIDAQVLSFAPDKHQVKFNITVFNEEVSYFVIRQPKDVYGKFFYFIIGEKILSENHPIPIGADLGIKEIPIATTIMVDFINMLLLIWSKFYMRFTGYQGVQAIDGLVKLVHEWVTLETSLEEESIEDYHRCYRWFRWESEKVRNKAKHDPDLSGNLWIEEILFEMIDYMEMHHFNKLPEWYDIGNMDEQRNSIFSEVDFDIPIIVDKVKGIRKRVLEKHKAYSDI